MRACLAFEFERVSAALSTNERSFDVARGGAITCLQGHERDRLQVLSILQADFASVSKDLMHSDDQPDRRSHEVFRLFGNCIPVRGARRSVICDLERRRIRFIPTALLEILVDPDLSISADSVRRFPPADRIRLAEYLDVLVLEEYGFWTDEPELFPTIEMKRDTPNACTNAILDIDRNSTHAYEAIFHQLDDLGCEALQIRAFDTLQPEEIVRIVVAAESGRFRHLDFMLKASPSINVEFAAALVKAHPIVTRVILHSAPEPFQQVDAPPPADIWVTTEPLSLTSCGQVDPSFFALNVLHFIEAQCFNTCLHKKVGVAANGDVMACPSMNRSFGNIATTELKHIVGHPDLKRLGTITKDQVSVCRDCEFRYVCTDCRANTVDGGLYSKPSGCRYDPYTATWI